MGDKCMGAHYTTTVYFACLKFSMIKELQKKKKPRVKIHYTYIFVNMCENYSRVNSEKWKCWVKEYVHFKM